VLLPVTDLYPLEIDIFDGHAPTHELAPHTTIHTNQTGVKRPSDRDNTGVATCLMLHTYGSTAQGDRLVTLMASRCRTLRQRHA
jgi:hypothetical protein